MRADIVEQLLADNDFRVTLAGLRLPGGSRLGVLGASMSVDAVDWVTLLSDVLAAARPHVELVDHCSIGCTTADALVALPGLISQRPNHILIMLGVDDARRHGAASGVLRVSTAETHRNLSVLRAMAQAEAHVGTTLITPPPAHPRREQFADSYWLAEDLSSVVNVVRSIDPDAVCLRTGTPPGQDYWLADGVRPSAVGHTDIVRRIINHFSRAHQGEESGRPRIDAASRSMAPNTPTAASRG
ncbi:SGNH/GDSL hydrolase family protein [Mycolicibacterium cosmeticum]|uniref:SGNH/GDSL hydrolase family protein n=1 Tax=Mycolicibacterium cosmeticum TaxID=258533 RepID=UPI003204AFCA